MCYCCIINDLLSPHLIHASASASLLPHSSSITPFLDLKNSPIPQILSITECWTSWTVRLSFGFFCLLLSVLFVFVFFILKSRCRLSWRTATFQCTLNICILYHLTSYRNILHFNLIASIWFILFNFPKNFFTG